MRELQHPIGATSLVRKELFLADLTSGLAYPSHLYDDYLCSFLAIDGSPLSTQVLGFLALQNQSVPYQQPLAVLALLCNPPLSLQPPLLLAFKPCSQYCTCKKVDTFPWGYGRHCQHHAHGQSPHQLGCRWSPEM